MKLNNEIRLPQVRLIADNGEQLGLMSSKEAYELALKAGKDLVLIAPNANPPVCKIIDYGKLKYQQTKKEKESKKAQHKVKVKEVKVRPNIDIHDLNTKMNHAKEFLSKGNKVRIVCMFRGREMLHMDLGKKLIDKVIEELSEISTVEAPAKVMGRNLQVVLAPLGKTGKN